MWALNRVCPALRTVLLRGQVELTTLRMHVPSSAIARWDRNAGWPSPHPRFAATTPRRDASLDDRAAWRCHCRVRWTHFLGWDTPLTWRSCGWTISYASLRVRWRCPCPSSTSLRRATRCGSRGGARPSPEHGTDLCLLLARGLMLGSRHCLRTLALTNVVFHVLNIRDLPTRCARCSWTTARAPR